MLRIIFKLIGEDGEAFNYGRCLNFSSTVREAGYPVTSFGNDSFMLFLDEAKFRELAEQNEGGARKGVIEALQRPNDEQQRVIDRLTNLADSNRPSALGDISGTIEVSRSIHEGISITFFPNVEESQIQGGSVIIDPNTGNVSFGDEGTPITQLLKSLSKEDPNKALKILMDLL